MITKTLSMYNRDEVYTYREAAEVVGVRYDVIANASRLGILTSTRIAGNGALKFVLKSEVDAVAGTKEVTSKVAQAKINEVRRIAELDRKQHAIDELLESHPDNTYVQSEMTYGEQFTISPELPSSPRGNDLLSILQWYADGMDRLGRLIDTYLTPDHTAPRSR